MIAIDTNILVYSFRTDVPWFAKADALVQGLVEGDTPWCIPWPCIHEFFSVVTNPRIYKEPAPTASVFGQIESWLGSPSCSLIGETRSHWRLLKGVIEAGRIAGPMVHDARIAAICLQHGVTTLWSADRDLTRFSGLRVVNPLV